MKEFLLKRLPQISLAVLILLLMIALASKQSLFLQSATAAQIFKYYSPMAMLALGMTFIILTGGIDLSVGFVMMLVMFVMAGQMRDHPQMSPALALSTSTAYVPTGTPASRKREQRTGSVGGPTPTPGAPARSSARWSPTTCCALA